MSKNEAIEQRIIDALNKQEPMMPRKFELGGGYYYKCYWVACDETLYRWMNYCPKCGNKISWGE